MCARRGGARVGGVAVLQSAPLPSAVARHDLQWSAVSATHHLSCCLPPSHRRTTPAASTSAAPPLPQCSMNFSYCPPLCRSPCSMNFSYCPRACVAATMARSSALFQAGRDPAFGPGLLRWLEVIGGAVCVCVGGGRCKATTAGRVVGGRRRSSPSKADLPSRPMNAVPAPLSARRTTRACWSRSCCSTSSHSRTCHPSSRSRRRSPTLLRRHSRRQPPGRPPPRPTGGARRRAAPATPPPPPRRQRRQLPRSCSAWRWCRRGPPVR